MQVTLTPVSAQSAIAEVERTTGERPERAEWQFGHWLLGTPAPGRRPRISTEHRRWVVVPGAGCQEVCPDTDTELVGVRMLAASGLFQLAIRPGFARVALLMWALFQVINTIVCLVNDRRDWTSLGWFPIASTLLMLGGLLVHELGHVAAAMTLSDRWIGLRLDGDGMAVQFWPAAHQGWRCAVRSLAGPVAQLAYSALLMLPMLSDDPGGRLQWVLPGVFGILLAIFQMLPVPGMDGGRALAEIRDTTSRRSV